MKTGLEGKTEHELDDLIRRGWFMHDQVSTRYRVAGDQGAQKWKAAGRGLVGLVGVERARRLIQNGIDER